MTEKDTNTPKIARFIQTSLITRLKNDGKKLYIASEGDLQSSVYWHLRRHLRKYPKWAVYNKQTIGKKRKSKTYPDLVISRFAKNIQPKILIELKEFKKFKKRPIKSDLKKLQKFKSRKKTRYGFVIVVCRKDKRSTGELNKIANDLVPTKFKKTIIPIVINLIDFIPGRQVAKWEERLEQATKIRL